MSFLTVKTQPWAKPLSRQRLSYTFEQLLPTHMSRANCADIHEMSEGADKAPGSSAIIRIITALMTPNEYPNLLKHEAGT